MGANGLSDNVTSWAAKNEYNPLLPHGCFWHLPRLFITMVILVQTKCWKTLNFWTKKMKMLRKNKASHCKNKNVWYPKGHLLTWLFFYSVNDSYSLQYSTNIWNRIKTRKCWKCQPLKKWRIYFPFDISSNWFK